MTPELWKMLIGSVVIFLTAAAGLFKVWTDLAKVKADRESTKHERDTKIALLEQECKFLRGRLDEGQDRFDKIDVEIKSMNDKFSGKMETMSEKLTTIITKFDSMIAVQKRSHTPEDKPL